mmetsp:Transcript_21026/g.25840  ORF Transcript_21026/g.25840 Transcript_21026/m.25840 type:complete len:135 (+) Transcript_21026:1922-2326(+)
MCVMSISDKENSEKVHARLWTGLEWMFSYPSPQIAMQTENKVLISTVEQSGKLRFVALKIPDKQEKEGEDSSDGEQDEFVQELIWEAEDPSRWSSQVDYPLVACADKERPQEIRISHMTNGMQEKALHILDQNK